VGFGDRQRDRQAEPETTGLAATERLGTREPAEDPLQIRFRDAAARVRHGEHGVPVFDPRAQLDRVVGPGVGDGVLKQRVKSHRQPVPVAEDGRLGYLAEPPPARGVSPAVERVDHYRVDAHRRDVEEAGVSSAGEQQQAAGQLAQPRELADDHAGILGHHLVGGGLLDELGVAECHRDRRAELVRGVEQEQPLLFEQPEVFLRYPLHLVHRRQPLLERRLTPPPVPDHRQEHQRYKRDLDQVVPVLHPVHDLRHDDPAGRQRHHRHRQQGRLQPPHPEAVNDGQAHPDDEKGDRRPGLHLVHGEQVYPDENGPDNVYPGRPCPPERAVHPARDTPTAHVAASAPAVPVHRHA
jgi:hypothetical protein